MACCKHVAIITYDLHESLTVILYCIQFQQQELQNIFHFFLEDKASVLLLEGYVNGTTVICSNGHVFRIHHAVLAYYEIHIDTFILPEYY